MKNTTLTEVLGHLEGEGRIAWCAYITEDETQARVGVIGVGIIVGDPQEREGAMRHTEVASVQHNMSENTLSVGEDKEMRPGEVGVWFDVDIE